MSLSAIELRWSTGVTVHLLQIAGDGTPTIRSEPMPDAAPPAPGAGSGSPPAAATVRRGRRWTAEEEAEVVDAFDAGESPGTIARRLDRSRGAVTARLVRLGRIDEGEAGLRYPVGGPARPPGGSERAPP